MSGCLSMQFSFVLSVCMKIICYLQIVTSWRLCQVVNIDSFLLSQFKRTSDSTYRLPVACDGSARPLVTPATPPRSRLLPPPTYPPSASLEPWPRPSLPDRRLDPVSPAPAPVRGPWAASLCWTMTSDLPARVKVKVIPPVTSVGRGWRISTVGWRR